GDPLYIKKAGYTTLLGVHGGVEGVDQTTQAKLELNMIMDAAKLGVADTYLYDLIDYASDPLGKTAADHYGLFTTSNTPKTVATAIHNLTTILSDTGAAAATFTPTPLGYAISGLPSTGSSYLLEKSSGVYDLVIWAEPSVWSAATHMAASAAAQSVVTVSLASSFAQASVYDPLLSSNAIATGTNINTIKVGVTDHPMIIQLSQFVQSIASFKAPGDTAVLTNAGSTPQSLAQAVTLSKAG
ncbi:MAG: hypothetical protein JO303_17215, partial [Caulobacteraceae bacterium]|nr:hypothetical protein [Caulobacteraceae bacterium]